MDRVWHCVVFVKVDNQTNDIDEDTDECMQTNGEVNNLANELKTKATSEVIIAELFSFETVVIEIEHAVLDVDVEGVFKHSSGIGNVS